MFEITVTREFELWFQALEPNAAELVAAELDVLESAGPALDPVRASRLLLWYDGTAPWASDGVGEWLIRMRESADSLRELLLWQQEAVRCLESPTFQARVANLDRDAANRALLTIERVKESLRANRLWAGYRAGATRSAPGAPPEPKLAPALTPQQRSLIAARLGHGLALRHVARDHAPSADSVQRALREVLSLVGLEFADLVDGSSGLREVTITAVTPHLRLIYGIDVPQHRIVALVGERLDHTYYGDSVRLAEQRWREYQESAAQSAEAP
jgi:hypothetical protein